MNRLLSLPVRVVFVVAAFALLPIQQAKAYDDLDWGCYHNHMYFCLGNGNGYSYYSDYWDDEYYECESEAEELCRTSVEPEDDPLCFSFLGMYICGDGDPCGPEGAWC